MRHDSSLSLLAVHTSYFLPSRKEPPRKVGRTVALVKGIFTATTILSHTKAPKEVVLLRAKIIIIGLWLFCLGQIHIYYQMWMLLTPDSPTSIISSISTAAITNFVHCYLIGRSWRTRNHWGRSRRLMQPCSMVVEFFLIGASGDRRAVEDSKGYWDPNRWQISIIMTVANIYRLWVLWQKVCEVSPMQWQSWNFLVMGQAPNWMFLLPSLCTDFY